MRRSGLRTLFFLSALGAAAFVGCGREEDDGILHTEDITEVDSEPERTEIDLKFASNFLAFDSLQMYIPDDIENYATNDDKAINYVLDPNVSALYEQDFDRLNAIIGGPLLSFNVSNLTIAGCTTELNGIVSDLKSEYDFRHETIRDGYAITYEVYENEEAAEPLFSFDDGSSQYSTYGTITLIENGFFDIEHQGLRERISFEEANILPELPTWTFQTVDSSFVAGNTNFDQNTCNNNQEDIVHDEVRETNDIELTAAKAAAFNEYLNSERADTVFDDLPENIGQDMATDGVLAVALEEKLLEEDLFTNPNRIPTESEMIIITNLMNLIELGYDIDNLLAERATYNIDASSTPDAFIPSQYDPNWDLLNDIVTRGE